MTVTLLKDVWTSGSTADAPNLVYQRLYRSDTIMDFVNFVSKAPLKDNIMQLDDIGPFWVDSVDFTKVTQQPNGEVLFTADYKLKTMNPSEVHFVRNNPPPWAQPVSDFSVSPATEEIAVEQIYPPNSLAPVRLCNSAGVALEASGYQGLCTISFSYNSLSFDPNAVWGFKSTVNAFNTLVCGMAFPPRTLLVDTYSGAEQIEYDEDGNIKWQYFKISVSLTANPKTWNKQYLNLGTHVWTNGGLEQLWKWIDDDGRTHFEPYSSFLHWIDNQRGDESRGEAITDPMFLNNNGTGISGFRGYQQIPTYVEGCPFYPADFSFLDLPATRGWRF